MSIVSETLQELLAQFLAFLPDLLAALVIFVAGLYVAGVLTKLVRQMMERRKADAELTLFFTQVTRWTVVVLVLVVSLEQVGFDLTAFLAGLGILGFTIGFALQDVSKNFFAGLLLLLEQPFNIGDVIEVGDFIGEVANIELRATELYTFDGQNVIIPNADVFTSPIKNYSLFDKRRIELKGGVSYDTDLERARQVAIEMISKVEGVMNDPAPRLIFDNLGGSTVDFTLFYWVDLAKADYQESIDAGIVGVKQAYEENQIEMPFPTQEIRLVKQ